jgi:hypothetical protein
MMSSLTCFDIDDSDITEAPSSRKEESVAKSPREEVGARIRPQVTGKEIFHDLSWMRRGGAQQTNLAVGANEERLVVPQDSEEDRPHGGVHQGKVEMLPAKGSQESQEGGGHVSELLLGARVPNHKDRLSRRSHE